MNELKAFWYQGKLNVIMSKKLPEGAANNLRIISEDNSLHNIEFPNELHETLTATMTDSIFGGTYNQEYIFDDFPVTTDYVYIETMKVNLLNKFDEYFDALVDINRLKEAIVQQLMA
jgi:hypothetical protein